MVSTNTHIERTHTMSKILEKLTKFFEINKQSQLEQFINSKRPTNAAEVEYWIRQYETGLVTYWRHGL
jgi:hypothetical protein